MLGRTLQPPVDVTQGSGFQHCPWPRTCMAPCVLDAPATVLCQYPDGDVEPTSFACCCCGTGTNSFRLLPSPAGERRNLKPLGTH